MMGKPVVAGTRITVENILEGIGAGETVESLVAEHPRLTREAVLTAVQFGAQALRADVVYPLTGAGCVILLGDENIDNSVIARARQGGMKFLPRARWNQGFQTNSCWSWQTNGVLCWSPKIMIRRTGISTGTR